MIAEPGAPDPTPIELAYRLHVGTVLSDSFDVWMGNFFPFTIVALIVLSPLLLVPFALRLAGIGVNVSTWISLGLRSLLEGIVVFGVFEQLGGRRTSIGAMLRAGGSRAGGILLVAAAQLALTYIPTILLTMAAVLTLPGPFIAFPLFIIPAGVIMCMLWLAIPVAVVERGGVIHACSRSIELTKGSRWSVFGLILVVATAGGLLHYGLGLILPTKLLPPVVAVQLTELVRIFAQIPVQLLAALAAAVGYHDLRVHRESIDTDDLIAVFE